MLVYRGIDNLSKKLSKKLIVIVPRISEFSFKQIAVNNRRT